MSDHPHGQSDTVGDPAYGEMAPQSSTGPDPTTLPTLEEAYPRAHRAARTVLETIGLPQGLESTGYVAKGEGAERLVSLILGAALLELERPWRQALERANDEAARYWRDRNQLRQEVERVARQRDNYAAEDAALLRRLQEVAHTADRRLEAIDACHLALTESDHVQDVTDATIAQVIDRLAGELPDDDTDEDDR